MIIDGSSLLYRAFFALPPLKNALGLPTNAVYGFLTMLIKLYEQLQPDFVAVAFDKGKQTFRTELYDQYKGNRPNAPDDLRPQFPLIREVLESLGIRVIEEEGFEGDDIIGSLSAQIGSDEMKVSIITGDRDTLQLINKYSSVFLTKKGITEMLEVTDKNMVDLYGYGPDKVVEMKSLMGDSSDNIPGVPGVGEKTALKLITDYETLEGVYTHIDDISGKKLKERLVDNKEMAFLSRQLAAIKTDMNIQYEMTDFVPAIHLQEVAPLFEKLGFHNLVAKLQHAFGLSNLDMPVVPMRKVTLLDSKALTETFYLNKNISIAMSLDGHSPFQTINRLYIAGDENQVIEVKGEDTDGINMLKMAVAKANQVITNDSKALIETLGGERPLEISLYKDSDESEISLFADKVGNAIVRDIRILDVTLMAYLLDPTRTNYGITYLCERFEVPSVTAQGDALEGAETALALLEMGSRAKDEVEQNKLWDLYATIELPLVYTLAVMEKNGIYINLDALAETRQRFASEVKQLEEDIYAEAGETFNINSPKQLGVILFEKLELPIIKKTKTGYSTDAEVLDILRYDHPIVEKILAYRTVMKLLSTYLDGLGQLVNEKTKRIHTSFNQMVTATGRLSSSEPNLQNIPVRTEKGREIRALFEPGEGYDTLVSADYSQIELRVLAHLSEDPALIKAFVEGEDIHRFTAAEVLGKKLEDVTATERSQAKAVNFGIVYGISDFGLSRDLGITRGEAKEYIALYFSRYPKVKEYMDAMVAMAHEQGEVRTMFGRVRALPEINSSNFNRRSFAERTAMNTPIQGSAADIIKLAMNQVEEWLREKNYKSRLLLQVHDELVLEVVEAERTAIEKGLAHIMESVVDLKVPLIVDVHSADNWALVK